MPHSLRVKIKGLRYKGIITDKDCERLCKALDNENVLEQIRAEIEQIQGNEYEVSDMQGNRYKYETIEKAEALQIIDKYKRDKE